MRKPSLLLATSILTLILLGLASTTLAGPDSRTFQGRYEWSSGGSRGDLEAHFTPTGETTWNVAFDFEFRGHAHTYEGTAEGSLSNGRLDGKVYSENGRRTFTFEGTMRNGTFKGTHAELIDGRPRSTGTLNLASAD